MKHSSLSRIFWGLLLSFFCINIFNLNLFTTFVGSLLIATAMWQLRKESKNFKYAFFCSIIQLALQAFGFITICSQMSGILNISIVTTVIDMINMIALLYNLLSGLQQLVLACGDELLGKKMHNCFVLYIIVEIAITFAMLIPPLIFIAFPAVLIVFIYILFQVNKASHVIDEREDIFHESKLNRRYFAMLGGYFALTILLCLSALLLKSRPIVQTEIYNRVDSGNQVVISKIKSKMLKWGFEKEIVNDLPDSEIKNYKNCLSAEINANYRSIDGGALKLTQCTANFKGGKIRLLFYFTWTKLPFNQFCDNINVDLNLSMFSIPYDTDFNGFTLFDKKNKKRLTTYKADFAKSNSTNSIIDTVTPTVSYRVFGADEKNQRGFFAYNIQSLLPDEGMSFETVINYYHQNSLFNFNSTSSLSTPAASQQQMFNTDNPYGSAFYETQFTNTEEIINHKH